MGKNMRRRMKDRASSAQRIGELCKYVRCHVLSERTLPDGWVMMFVARGMRVQKAVCHDTVEELEDEAEVAELVCCMRKG
jgi:hypothetical protein